MRAQHRWSPTLAVVAVILVVVLGGYVTAGALSTSTAAPFTVGRSRVDPAGGWRFVDQTRGPGGAGAGSPVASGTLDVVTGPAVGTRPGPREQYVLGSLEPGSASLTVSPGLDAVTLDGGLPAVRLSYSGCSIRAACRSRAR